MVAPPVMLCGGTWGIGGTSKQYKKSHEERHVSLSQMLRHSKFTVYAPDAYSPVSGKIDRWAD